MPNLVKDCADVSDCSTTSWDLLFCICSAQDQVNSECTVATMDPTLNAVYPFLSVGLNDSISGLQGQYSTTASEASTLPTTGFGTNTWSDIDNALQDDGSYATIIGSTLDLLHADHPSFCIDGSEYIVLKGWGFTIPPTAKIWGISIGVKGDQTITDVSQDFAVAGVFNMALISNGVPYYRCDPRSYNNTSSDISDVRCGPPAAAPYPTNPNPYGISPFEDTFDLFGQPHSQVGFDAVLSDTEFGWPREGALFAVPTNPLQALGNFGSTFGQPNAPILRGTVLECNPVPIPSDSANGYLGPIEKDLAIPTLKQTWTPDEVNDSGFGVAVSVNGLSFLFHTGFFQQLTIKLNCLGVAVYYTMNQNPPPAGNPLVTGCEGN